MDRLAAIIAHKRQEIVPVIARAETLRAAALQRNDFFSLEANLRRDAELGLGLIAEVKKASPSAGDIATDVDPVEQARLYAGAGASAISVLTDEKFFRGRLEYLTRVRRAVDVPVLRKDFIVHEAQIYEAVVAGADAVLLIVAALDPEEYRRLLGLAHAMQLEVLVEVHNEQEMEVALESEARIIGVNNRNLKTFEVDLTTTESLLTLVDDGRLLVSESGIRSLEDAARVKAWGADAALVGEALMRAPDVPAMVAGVMGG